MSMAKPKPNYRVKIHETTRQWVIPHQFAIESEELYIYQTEDAHGHPVLLYHTYDYSETDRGDDEVEYKRSKSGRQTSIPAAVYDEDWDSLLVQKFENAHGIVLECYPETDGEESNQGE